MNGKFHPPSRSGRSNIYSESKSTNWMRFDPYQGERTSLPRKLAPASRFQVSVSATCDIYELPLHEEFVRPFGTADVESVLATIPCNLLSGLRRIYLMGGTRKQATTALGDLYRYGEYDWCDIYLFAFPRRRLQWRCRQLPRPHVCHEYRRAGASFRHDGNGWVCHLDEASLRNFYLFDVLVHEIGHHVDRFNWRYDGRGKTYRQAERFAESFVRHYGLRVKRT